MELCSVLFFKNIISYLIYPSIEIFFCHSRQGFDLEASLFIHLFIYLRDAPPFILLEFLKRI